MRRLLLLSALIACDTTEAPDAVDDPTGLPPELRPTGDEFLVAVLPDTQVYAMREPEIFEAQLKWIAAYADAYDIAFVSHVGDIVQTGSEDDQWAVARAAYDWIDDADVPHGLGIGSHDIGSSSWAEPVDSSCANSSRIDCEARDFQERFGPEVYEGRSWYLGSSPSGLSNAQRVSAGGMDLLFLHLAHDTPRAEVDWAHEVLDANPGTLAHVTTHRYLFDYRLTCSTTGSPTPCPSPSGC
jgi:hypothetical protein